MTEIHTKYTIEEYQEKNKNEWDKLVHCAENGLFLFIRNYVEYHADRFHELSYLVYKNGQLVALLPGNVHDHSFYSHQGLTFGGLIFRENTLRLEEVVIVYELIIKKLKERNLSSFTLQSIPTIFKKTANDSEKYVSFLLGGRLVKAEPSTFISLSNRIQMNDNRKQNIEMALQHANSIVEDVPFESFWGILENELATKHQVKPTHSLREIKLLQSQFPDGIKSFVVQKEGIIKAAIVMYIYPYTAHVQYMISTEQGRVERSLDLLINHLLKKYKVSYHYFSFGISSENGGLKLNEGLQYYKESFGGKIILHETFKIDF